MDSEKGSRFKFKLFRCKKSWLSKTYSTSILRRTLFVLIGILIWSLVVLPVFLIYRNEAYAENTPVKYEILHDKKDNIEAYLTITDIDLHNRKISLFVSFEPKGKYLLKNETLSESLSFSIGYEDFYFEEFKIMKPAKMSFPLMNGNVRDYPFDAYDAFLLFNMRDKNNTEVTTFLSICSTVQSLTTKTEQISNNKIKIKIRRSKTTFMFSIFVTILMWALSISITNIAWDIVYLKTDPPSGILSLGISMMFALPALRQTQPGIPNIGCLADVLGFFWNMMLISICSVLIIYIWTSKWKTQIGKNISRV